MCVVRTWVLARGQALQYSATMGVHTYIRTSPTSLYMTNGLQPQCTEHLNTNEIRLGRSHAALHQLSLVPPKGNPPGGPLTTPNLTMQRAIIAQSNLRRRALSHQRGGRVTHPTGYSCSNCSAIPPSSLPFLHPSRPTSASRCRRRKKVQDVAKSWPPQSHF